MLCLFMIGILANQFAHTSRLPYEPYNETVIKEEIKNMRQTCPYSDACWDAKDASRFSPEGLASCCLDCLCDDRCPLFGDCCPGVELNAEQLNKTLLECKPSNIMPRNLSIPIFSYREMYRLIDECPLDFNGEEDVVEKCTGNFKYTDFDEIVFVSDPTGITYLNKYCAQCNGVIDGIRWALVIGPCLEPIEKQHLAVTEAKQFVLNHCELYNTWSEKVPRNIRTLSCKNYRDCGDDEKYQSEVNGCQVEPGFQDSPYIASLSPNTNALCYKCYFISENRLCKKALAGQKGPDSLQFLLNTQIEDIAADEPIHARCGESFVFDGFTGSCKRLYCPPYHVVSYGDCIPLIMSDVTQYVPLTVVVKVDVNFTEYNNRELAMELAISLTNYFVSLKDAMDKIFVFPNCKPVEYRLSAMIEETLRDCLVITITYETNETCSIRQLRNDVLEIPVQFALPTFYPEVEDRLNASSEWTLTFFELFTVFDLGSVYLSRLPFSRNPPPSLSVFFLCPYLILSMTEYKEFVKVKDRALYNDQEYLEMFEPTTKTLAGFYPISKTEIAVCLDTYFVADSGSLTRLGSIDVLLVAITFIRIVVLM